MLAELVLDVVGKLTVVVGEAVVGVVWEDRPQWWELRAGIVVLASPSGRCEFPSVRFLVLGSARHNRLLKIVPPCDDVSNCRLHWGVGESSHNPKFPYNLREPFPSGLRQCPDCSGRLASLSERWSRQSTAPGAPFHGLRYTPRSKVESSPRSPYNYLQWSGRISTLLEGSRS